MLAWERTATGAESPEVIERVDAVVGFVLPFAALGWITPHAWAVETYQALIWRGDFNAGVLAGWAALGGVGLAGIALAVMMEHRRAGR